MSKRCADCGRFAGKDHTCPDYETVGDGPTETPCQNPACEKTHRNEKYCSSTCMHDAHRERPDTKTCQQCGEVFDVSPNVPDQKYCGRTCYADSQRSEPVDVSGSQEGYVVTDEHVVFSVDNKLMRISVDRWDAICKDYSEYGGDLTQAETARKHGVPLPLMRRVLRAYGQYKASPPMMRERIAEAESLEPLVKEAVENAEYELLNKIERRRERKIKREWRQMRERLQDEERFTEAGERVAKNMGKVATPGLTLQKTATWPAAVAPTTDEHFGLPVWGEGSWGENYDTDIAARRLVGQGKRGAAWVSEQGGAEVVYRVYGGDLFNAIYGSTTHDTPMDQDTRDEKVWDITLRAVLLNAQAWRQACDRLVVLFLGGNHDGPKVYQFASAIRFALEGSGNVEVRATPKKYDAVRVGETLHVFDHGASLSKLSGYKAQVDAETVARKVAGEAYHGADSIVYHVGHRHDRMVVTVGDHLEIVRHPALCESSEYEHENRWVATPCADVMLLDERGRIDTPKRLYRDVLDEAGQRVD